MAKRKKPRPKKKATLGEVLGIVKKPQAIYRCLECGNQGPPKEMLVSVMVGDHEMPNGRVVPGKIVVKASVCRFCHEKRMENDGGNEGNGSAVPQ